MGEEQGREILGVAGVRGEIFNINAGGGEGFFPFFFIFGAENELRFGGGNNPIVIYYFLFQLKGFPAGVAQSNDVVPGAGAKGNVADDVYGRGDGDVAVDDNGIGFDIVCRVNDKTANLFKRASLMKVNLRLKAEILQGKLAG